MRSINSRHLILLNIFVFITVSDILDYGILDDDVFDGSIMDYSYDLFASDDASLGMTSIDPSEMIFMDISEDDGDSGTFVSIADDCTGNVGELPLIGKTRRGDMCHDNEDHTNEQPFVLPSILLDAATIKMEKYCPVEIFDEGSLYLVCSSGFSMDILDYGLAYQALLNSELGKCFFACTAPVSYPCL